MSPTSKRAALSGMAFMSACISMTSTMEVSSTTNKSQSSGFVASGVLRVIKRPRIHVRIRG
jgi:hypothetical protein